jgi:putative nucleotidyltransferase with HDIG domain
MSALLLRDSSPPRPPATELRRTVLNGLDRVETYPTLSATAVRVMAMADRDDVSVAEVSEVVRCDGVMATSVLRRANSCAFRGRNEIGDLQQAVLRIGVGETARLLCAISVRRVYEGYSEQVRARCEGLLRHSLFVARLASGLAKLGSAVLPELAFTAGLVHDIGRVVLCVKCDGVLADPPAAREDDETPGAERAAYGVDHCAIGYQLATRNALPEPIVRTALNHHRPEEEVFHQQLVALVAVAERVANHVQWKHNVAEYDLDTCPRFEVLSSGWPSKRESAFRSGLGAATVRAIRDTRQMLKAIG